MKVSELEGAMLDYWVARADGFKYPQDLRLNCFDGVQSVLICVSDFGPWKPYTPSTDWAQGGPIIEREKIELLYFGSDGRDGNPWEAQMGMDTHYIDQNPGDAMGGPEPLVAAMRAFVASKFGDAVPDEVAG